MSAPVTKTPMASAPMANPSAPVTRSRGRPAIEWTEHRQRRLLRVYLGTTPEALSTKNIRSLLAEEGFAPKERKTQDVLHSLLSKSYVERRPKTREDMARRLEFLKSVKRPSCDSTKYEFARIQETIRDDTRELCHTAATKHGGLAVDLCSQYLPRYFEDGYEATSEAMDIDEPPLIKTNLVRGSLDVQSTVSSDLDVNQQLRHQKRSARKAEVKKTISSPRSSSVLGDIVSLLSSSLSLHDSLSLHLGDGLSPGRLATVRASFTLNARFAFLSHLPRTKRTKPARSPVNPSTISSPISSLTSGSPSCSGSCVSGDLSTAPCVHQRLATAIQGGSWGGLWLTEQDVRSLDIRENTLLHVAAKHGAPLPYLTSLIQQGVDPTAKNKESETFLHVYAPLDTSEPTPAEMFEFTTYLRHIDFNFCVPDFLGMTIINRWLLSPNFGLDLLQAFCVAAPPSAVRNSLCGDTEIAKDARQHLQFKMKKEGVQVDIHKYLAFLAKRYEDEYVARRVPANNTIWDLPAVRPGWNLLHQLAAGIDLATVQFSMQITDEKIYGLYLDTINVLLQDPELDVNNREHSTDRTPIMTVLQCVCWSPATNDHLLTLLSRLIRAGASLDARDARGYTPLHYAVQNGLGLAVRFLCERGADINVAGCDEVTPLGLARLGLRQQRKTVRGKSVAATAALMECAAVLMDYGACLSSEKKPEDWKRWVEWEMGRMDAA